MTDSRNKPRATGEVTAIHRSDPMGDLVVLRWFSIVLQNNSPTLILGSILWYI